MKFEKWIMVSTFNFCMFLKIKVDCFVRNVTKKSYFYVILNRYEKERPALNICITTEFKRDEVDKKMLWIHMQELALLKSHVCDKPVGWEGLGPV